MTFFWKGLLHHASVNYFAARLRVDVSKSVSMTNACKNFWFG
jgi:hypothetical protein